MVLIVGIGTRRVHVTQEDFDLATAKVLNRHDDKEMSLSKLWK
jgi:26S proteasome regulatory subunit T6